MLTPSNERPLLYRQMSVPLHGTLACMHGQDAQRHEVSVPLEPSPQRCMQAPRRTRRGYASQT